MPRRPTPSAFTLIELSVVLVIIGLLVGGIVSFRTYTKNAALTSMMNESKMMVDAYNQFQTTYGAPPGDFCSIMAPATACNASSNAVWPSAANGDGNGLISANGTATPNTAEIYYAFQHLSKAAILPGNYSGAVNAFGGATIGLNVPGSSMGKVAFMFDHPLATDGNVSGDAMYYDGLYGNVLRVAGLNDKSTITPSQPFLTPKQAYQLDDKFDDGLPGSGLISTPNSTALANCSTNATTYNTAGTNAGNPQCYIFIRIP